MEHSFDIEIAKKIGVNAAIIYKNISWWCAKNKANGAHFHDGHYWTYNSTKAFKLLFPYLGEKQIRNAIKKLVGHGYLITGNYSSNKYDRTTWYADIHTSEESRQKGQNAFGERANGNNQKGESHIYKYINTDKNRQPPPKNNKNIFPPEKYISFSEKFYRTLSDKYNGRKNIPKKSIIQGAEAIRKLVEIDKFDLDSEITPAIKWALEDSFWSAQIRSLAALRKKSKGAADHKFQNMFNQYSAAGIKKFENLFCGTCRYHGTPYTDRCRIASTVDACDKYEGV